MSADRPYRSIPSTIFDFLAANSSRAHCISGRDEDAQHLGTSTNTAGRFSQGGVKVYEREERSLIALRACLKMLQTEACTLC